MAATLSPQSILAYTADKGVSKAQAAWLTLAILGFLGGAFISVGYLAYLRIASAFPAELLGLGKFIGAAVFPVGLICILIGGGELITGNMMVLPVAWLQRRITLSGLLRNWIIVSIFNLFGAMAVAWFFGHIAGLTEGHYHEFTLAVARGKVEDNFIRGVASGVGCNWLVCMGVWLCYATTSVSGKILGIWFPVMTFVAIGFQHVVANMFVIPAAIWGGGEISWAQFGHNMFSVYLGNTLGGALIVGLLYGLAYRE